MLIKNFSLSLDIRSRPGLVLNNMHQFYDLCSKFLRSSNSKSRVAHALVSLKNCSYLTSFFSLGTASLDPGGQVITRKWELSPEVRPTRFDEIRRGPKCRLFHEFSSLLLKGILLSQVSTTATTAKSSVPAATAATAAV